MAVTVSLTAIENAGPRQAAFAARAASMVQQALNDPRFASLMRSANYDERRYRGGDGVARTVTVDEALQLIFSGMERGTAADGTIALHVKLVKKRRGTLGSTIPGQSYFKTAYWFINDCLKDDEPWELAGHFLHEWLHVCGFYHYPDNKARDDVPYHAGTIVRSLLAPAASANKSAHPLVDYANVDCGANDDDDLGADPAQMI